MGRGRRMRRRKRAQYEYLDHQRADAATKNDEKRGGTAPTACLSQQAAGHAAGGNSPIEHKQTNQRNNIFGNVHRFQASGRHQQRNQHQGYCQVSKGKRQNKSEPAGLRSLPRSCAVRSARKQPANQKTRTQLELDSTCEFKLLNKNRVRRAPFSDVFRFQNHILFENIVVLLWFPPKHEHVICEILGNELRKWRARSRRVCPPLSRHIYTFLTWFPFVRGLLF
jgi:hypothetical protein